MKYGQIRHRGYNGHKGKTKTNKTKLKTQKTIVLIALTWHDLLDISINK
jgi:energy-coupling factor transporter transmembrane protein EcfT